MTKEPTPIKNTVTRGRDWDELELALAGAERPVGGRRLLTRLERDRSGGDWGGGTGVSVIKKCCVESRVEEVLQ